MVCPFKRQIVKKNVMRRWMRENENLLQEHKSHTYHSLGIIFFDGQWQ